MLSNSSKGQFAQLKIEIAAAERGYVVSRPSTGDTRYDLIIEINKKLYKTQIKYCNKKGRNHNCLELLLERKHLNQKVYKDSQIDLLLVYIVKIDKILAFYPKDFHNKKKISINLNNEKSKYYYKLFEW